MTRSALALALVLASFNASAELMPRVPGDTTPSTFTTTTLGEAAARIHDLGKPLRLQVRVVLPMDRTFPLEALHAYLKDEGFETVAEAQLENGRPIAGKPPLTLVGTRVSVMSSEQIDGYMTGVRGVVPEGVDVNWVFSTPE